MLVLLLAALSAPDAPSSADKVAPAPAAKPCARVSAQWAGENVLLSPRTLKQEPQAQAYLGVMHIRNGCDTPIKVSDWRERPAR